MTRPGSDAELRAWLDVELPRTLDTVRGPSPRAPQAAYRAAAAARSHGRLGRPLPSAVVGIVVGLLAVGAGSAISVMTGTSNPVTWGQELVHAVQGCVGQDVTTGTEGDVRGAGTASCVTLGWQRDQRSAPGSQTSGPGSTASPGGGSATPGAGGSSYPGAGVPAAGDPHDGPGASPDQGDGGRPSPNPSENPQPSPTAAPPGNGNDQSGGGGGGRGGGDQQSVRDATGTASQTVSGSDASGGDSGGSGTGSNQGHPGGHS